MREMKRADRYLRRLKGGPPNVTLGIGAACDNPVYGSGGKHLLYVYRGILAHRRQSCNPQSVFSFSSPTLHSVCENEERLSCPSSDDLSILAHRRQSCNPQSVFSFSSPTLHSVCENEERLSLYTEVPMRIRPLILLILLVSAAGCGAGDSGSALSLPPNMPPIVAKSIEFHGGNLYEGSTITMTITSLSGSFKIEATRQGGQFDHAVIGTNRQDIERRVRVTNDAVQEWRAGEEVDLDEEGTTRARAFGTNRQDIERRVRVTNDAVQEWRAGEEVDLDEEGTTRARAFVDARVFFPLLPYTLNGGDVNYEDLGIDNWEGRDLHKVRVSFTPGTSNDADDGYMFWFDPETGQMEQFGYDFDGGLRFRKGVEFQRVGGVMFSTQGNYAIDGGRVPVDMLSPGYVAENMNLLSTVVISDVMVEPL